MCFTKFQNPRSSSYREIFDENFHIHYLGVRYRKREKKKKKAKINLSTLILFSVIQIWLSSSCIQNLNTLAQIEVEKCVTENFVREKEKWTNKGTDMQYVADSLIHSTTCHYQAFYQISKS